MNYRHLSKNHTTDATFKNAVNSISSDWELSSESHQIELLPFVRSLKIILCDIEIIRFRELV